MQQKKTPSYKLAIVQRVSTRTNDSLISLPSYHLLTRERERDALLISVMPETDSEKESVKKRDYVLR